MNSKKESLWSKVSTFLVFASCNLRIPGRGNRTILIWCISDIYKLGRRIQQQTFVGLKNYAAVVADSSFWQSWD